MTKENCWLNYNEEEKKSLMDFSQNYINFMSISKTERETTSNILDIAFKKGFVDYETYGYEKCRKVGKFYFTNHGKNIALFKIGKKQDISDGFKIIGSHIDSPRIDVKCVPLYEDHELAYLDTHYYGGIKKYQWTAIPLAIHGVVCFKDGTKKNVEIGELEDDPVFCITDLLPHLDNDMYEKTAAKIIDGEGLDLLIGSIPSIEDKKTETYMVKILKENGIIQDLEDFQSAELEIVPSGKAKHFGMDKSMVMAYGQDDKVCAYTSMMALFDSESDNNVCALFVDKEEIGSVGNTGMESDWFVHTLQKIIKLYHPKADSSFILNECLENSDMLSADVDAAFDPLYSYAYEEKNSAKFGHGVTFSKFTGCGGKSGSNDANPEYIAKLRNIMESNGVAYQFSELGKVGQGGGGTIAYILANKCVNVIDCGTAVLNMHAPWEITSKSDIWETYKCYKVFYEN
ncbi:MAG: aminopeptidase [Paludibacteraceae bacterium]|nr:aminopeptidase [Paludibacteraceae bacterium]